MNADLYAESAGLALQSGAVRTPSAATVATAKNVAQDFEGVFLSQMFNEMFSGIETDGEFGGGPGEDMFRSLMVDEYGKQMAAQGGIGLGTQVMRELISAQEKRQ
jgi:peptidoglycan hydrolase FlgJ